MKNQLAEKLSSAKLNFKSYGELPIRGDVLLFTMPSREDQEKRTLLNQWEKLKYLQSHLATIDRYIRSNNGQTVNEWTKVHPGGLSQKVLDKIGNHNNKTGGISAYFFNLQNYYDEQEAIYDAMEAASKVLKEDVAIVDGNRKQRTDKRTNRRAMRKLLVKDMKANGKGYLEVVLDEEPPVVGEKKVSADGEKHPVEEKKETPTTETDPKTPAEPIDQSINTEIKNAGNVGVWIAGVTITIAAIFTMGAVMSKNR